jgi:hypothetical protein
LRRPKRRKKTSQRFKQHSEGKRPGRSLNSRRRSKLLAGTTQEPVQGTDPTEITTLVEETMDQQ